MNDLTLVIPAKYESESLPIFLEEIKNLTCKKLVVLQADDKITINSIKKFNDVEIFCQKELGSTLLAGLLHK